MANGITAFSGNPFDLDRYISEIKKWKEEHSLKLMLAQWSAALRKLRIAQEEFWFYDPPHDYERILSLLTEAQLKQACIPPESQLAQAIPEEKENVLHIRQIVVNPIEPKNVIIPGDIPDGQRFQIATVHTQPAKISSRGLPDLFVTTKELPTLREIADAYRCLSLAPPDEAQETHFAILAAQATKRPEQLSDHVAAELLDSVGKRFSIAAAHTWPEKAVDAAIEIATRPHKKVITILGVGYLVLTIEAIILAILLF